MDNRQIGRFIAECRKEKGLTQRELDDFSNSLKSCATVLIKLVNKGRCVYDF